VYAATSSGPIGLVAPERMRRFEPAPPDGDPSYDAVAAHADAAKAVAEGA